MGESRREGVRLVHVTTVAATLGLFRGQVGFMRERGFTLHFVSSPGEELQQFGRAEEVPVYGVEMSRRMTPFADLAGVVRLWRRLRQIDPVVVHAHTPKAALLGMLSSWLARVPVRVYHLRGLPLVTAGGWQRWLLSRTERISCALAHQVLCVSNSLRQIALDEGLCPPAKIKVLAHGSSNGVDSERRFDPSRFGPEFRSTQRRELGIPSEGLVIGFVGRLVRDKGVVELCEAWQVLRTEFPELHLLVIGPVEERDPVPQWVLGAFRSDPKVHMIAWADEVARLYSVMDVVALPTYREGFPNVPLEAAAMCLPVVVSAVTGCLDAVVDGVTGTMVPVRDGAALTAALRSYLTDPALRSGHGSAGRERVLRLFRQEILWGALHTEYLRLLSERDLPEPGSDRAPVSGD